MKKPKLSLKDLNYSFDIENEQIDFDLGFNIKTPKKKPHITILESKPKRVVDVSTKLF